MIYYALWRHYLIWIILSQADRPDAFSLSINPFLADPASPCSVQVESHQTYSRDEIHGSTRTEFAATSSVIEAIKLNSNVNPWYRSDGLDSLLAWIASDTDHTFTDKKMERSFAKYWHEKQSSATTSGMQMYVETLLVSSPRTLCSTRSEGSVLSHLVEGGHGAESGERIWGAHKINVRGTPRIYLNGRRGLVNMTC